MRSYTTRFYLTNESQAQLEVLGDPEPPGDRGPLGATVEVRRALDLGGGYAGDPLDLLRRVVGDQVLDRLEAGRPLGDELAIDEAVADHHVREPVEEGRVGARAGPRRCMSA